MDICGARLIGVGNTADVFDTGDGRVVKLYHAGYPRESVALELRNARLIEPFALPAPASHGLVEQDGRCGLVYDKVAGIPLLDVALETRDVQRCAEVLAALHLRILACALPDGDDCKALLAANLRRAKPLSAARREGALALLRRLPDGSALCHGDFHFGNVLVDGDDARFIDFYNLCRGAREFDIARTVYLTELTPVPDGTPDPAALLALKRRAAQAYLRRMGVDRAALADWLTVIAAARLAELRDEQTTEIASTLAFLEKQEARLA